VAGGAPAVVGLVLTLDVNETGLSATLAALAKHPELCLGGRHGPWLAATAVTNGPRVLHAWLEVLPGVLAVDVVFVEVAPGDNTDSRAGPISECSFASFVP
jgi:hypothetical protein